MPAVRGARVRPKVSVIMPARNEEEHVSTSLDAISGQKYPNYEITVLDDGSTDSTPALIRERAEGDPQVRFGRIWDHPKGWTGKNWACYLGYKRSRGDILLFTDADINASDTVLNDSVGYMVRKKLDALTLIPKVITLGFIPRLVQPTLGVIMSVFFSPTAVNNPKSKLAYFWGSYFLISRRAYEIIGGHEAVKSEIVEDRALGQRTKRARLRLQMIDGSRDFSAVWARSTGSLWRNLERITFSSLRGNTRSKVQYVSGTAVLFLPPVLLFLTISLFEVSSNIPNLIFALGGITLMILSSAYEAKHRLAIGYRYGLGVPLA
ncbi:MAG: glycosyltransferase, partial [Nitrososphaerales archaeon]